MGANKLKACVDCYMFSAYGNHSEMDECFEPEKWAARNSELEQAHLAAGNPSATCMDECDEFSNRPCEVCHSHMAGSRHVMTVLN